MVLPSQRTLLYGTITLLLIILFTFFQINVNRGDEIAEIRRELIIAHDQLHIERETSNEMRSELVAANSQLQMWTAEAAINKRMKHIRDVCNNRHQPNFNGNFMFHFKELKLTWAPVFKASSTNWKIFFIDQFHPNDRHKNDLSALNGHLLRRPERKRGEGGRLRTFTQESSGSTRFTIVRHPLSRLVSHYR